MGCGDARRLASRPAGRCPHDLLVGLDPHAMRDIWTRRHQIAEIPQPAILDLDHQWGDPSALSYAALYETGVYWDLTFGQSPPMPASDAVLLWPASLPGPDRDGPQEAAMEICPDPMDDALRMFWMGSPLCAKYLVRNQLWTALWFIESPTPSPDCRGRAPSAISSGDRDSLSEGSGYPNAPFTGFGRLVTWRVVGTYRGRESDKACIGRSPQPWLTRSRSAIRRATSANSSAVVWGMPFSIIKA